MNEEGVAKICRGHAVSTIEQRNALSAGLSASHFTHPGLVFRGDVRENPYYIAPAIFLGQKTSAADPVRHLLDSMAENTRLRRQLSAETEARLRSIFLPTA